MNVLILQLCVCFFFTFVSAITFWSSNNASIFDFSPSLKRKIHLVGALGGSKVKNLVFKSVGKNPEKITEKWEFLRITTFRQNRYFDFAVTQKRFIVNT
jgi:hypothetical protein